MFLSPQNKLQIFLFADQKSWIFDRFANIEIINFECHETDGFDGLKNPYIFEYSK